MTRPKSGRALFYTRDSGGRHEMTPSQYLEWSCRTAKKHSLTFDGNPDSIERMIRENRHQQGDVYLDYGVKGNTFDRKGLQALQDRIKGDHRARHVLIPRRDRLARPDDAIDAMVIERDMRRDGVTLVFMDQDLRRSRKGDVLIYWKALPG